MRTNSGQNIIVGSNLYQGLVLLPQLSFVTQERVQKDDDE